MKTYQIVRMSNIFADPAQSRVEAKINELAKEGFRVHTFTVLTTESGFVQYNVLLEKEADDE